MAVTAPQFQQRLPFVDKEGRLTNDGLRAINDSFKTLFGLIVQVAELAGVQIPDLDAAIQAANDAAAAANAAANSAQGAADTAAADSSLATSGVLGATITGLDLGASARATITSHDRVYGDGTSVSVNAGIINSLAYNTTYYIYYDDPTRTGGAVTYQASTNPSDAVQTGARHSVGVVTTPLGGGANSNGDGYPPAGVLRS